MDDALRSLRAGIDALDEQLLRLISERAALARKVGALKGDAPAYRPEREAQVLRRMRDNNPGPLPDGAIEHLFVEVISACRALEESISVAYLGPPGTFSEEAAHRRFGAAVCAAACASIDEVFRELEARHVDFGVVPVENSTDGAVGRTLDLLLATPAVVCGEVLLPVHQCLMSQTVEAPAVRIYAHSQSLAQCHEWLNRHYRDAQRVPVVSNAEAARMAAQEEGAAAIGSRAAATLYALHVRAENIEDNPNNTTRFAVIGHQRVAASGRDKTSLVMSAPNRPGAMHALLEPLATQGVSMTRLESRPSRTGMWEYVFFMDLEGHQDDAPVAAALKGLRERASFLKILGSYPVAD